MMDANKSEKFKRVCDGVWHDRETILSRRGALSGEVALIRAVYWRLCKTWGGSSAGTNGSEAGQMFPDYGRLVSIMLTQQAGPYFDGASLLNELVRQYREEAGQHAESRRELKARRR
jgi:hypothetical protein